MKTNKTIFAGTEKRLDIFVSENSEISRPFAQRMIKQGLVKVNGGTKKPSYMLSDGAVIETAVLDAGEDLNAEKKELSFEDMVFYEDEALMAVSKPAGLSVHPNSPMWEEKPEACLLGEPTLVSLLLRARPDTPSLGLSRLGLVHRLDRDTSGLMLISKTKEAQEELIYGFKERLMRKTYICAVGGIPDEESGTIDAPIGRAAGFKKIKVWEFGRDAVTEWEIMEKGEDSALLRIHPRTGRTNQIRIHMEFMGHPVLGDRLYHGRPADRMLLHSAELVFPHPETGRKKTLKCSPGKDFVSAWEKFKK